MRLIALEAVREFGRRWATSHHLQPNALIVGGRQIDREARARDQLCFVIRGLTRASDELVGDALQLPARGVMVCRHRFADRIRVNLTLESYTSLLVRSVTRDELFLDHLCKSVVNEDERRREIANRARADALTVSCQRPAFELGRRAALARYFAQGGSAALADRNRKRADLKSTSVASE